MFFYKTDINGFPENWQELIIASQSGNKTTYAIFLNKVRDVTAGFLTHRLDREGPVEEVTQDILRSVHRALHTYDPKYNFNSWLLSIINYKIKSHMGGKHKNYLYSLDEKLI